ncbi:MAG: OmpA family protein [Bacteroidia bacterium]|nr:OmpA family protein [Bacteroidia bacterium]
MKINKYSLAVLILLLSYNLSFSQQLTPTETKALLEVSVTNFSGKPLPKEIIDFVGKKNKTPLTVTTDKDGKAKVLLPEGDIYDVKYRDFMEQVNYTQVDIPTELGALTYQLDIKFEPEKVFTLKDVHFETAKATLTSNSFASLNDLVGALKANPTMVIEIAGHTDNVGTDETNNTLSQERANSVMKYLISKGIAANRVSAKGYGSSQSVASNKDEAGRQQNRRTEVRIIKE